MICASVKRFFTSDLPFRMIGLSTEVLLKMGGTSGLQVNRFDDSHRISGRAIAMQLER